MLKKSVVINGHRYQVSHMRNSKKGAEVVGGRFHVKGLGTVYIQIYEQAPKEVDKAHVASHAEPTPERKVSQVDEMIVETLRAMSAKIEALQKRSILLPEGTILPPRPSINGH